MRKDIFKTDFSLFRLKSVESGARGEREMKNFEVLAGAIIARAVLDNVNARLRLMKNPNNHQAKHAVTETEEFFFSPWYKQLAAIADCVDLARLQAWADETIRQAQEQKGSVNTCHGARVVVTGTRTAANRKQKPTAQ